MNKLQISHKVYIMLLIRFFIVKIRNNYFWNVNLLFDNDNYNDDNIHFDNDNDNDDNILVDNNKNFFFFFVKCNKEFLSVIIKLALKTIIKIRKW